ncbi:hypothetical protein GCM10007886_41620 [Methylobacterium gregans]|nr:hypothetical protein GCM10007886_41620 [Methylobacterium gregans]
MGWTISFMGLASGEATEPGRAAGRTRPRRQPLRERRDGRSGVPGSGTNDRSGASLCIALKGIGVPALRPAQLRLRPLRRSVKPGLLRI